jgi:hypothetical protein
MLGIPLWLIVVWAAAYLYWLLSRWSERIKQADSILEKNQTPGSVDKLPKSPDFVITVPGGTFTPTTGKTDSPEAVRFKTALRDLYVVLAASAAAPKEPTRQKLDLPSLTNTVIEAINPENTIRGEIFYNILLPDHLKALIGEEFKEAMAYPEIDIPMYKPLAEISSELLLPNINYIEQNSITLLETNRRFIEAYMVGLNHEFARELLWREYPTDQRGSYFRQFWDVSSYLNTENLNEEQLREKLRDIPPLHQWPKASKLGDHDHRKSSGVIKAGILDILARFFKNIIRIISRKKKEEEAKEVVLVIRGELLKRYPTAVIYANRAKWQMKNGRIDNTQERRLVDLTPAEEENPPRDKVRTPLYEAKVEPDIYFFGFDLLAEQAKGGSGENPSDDPGWFFVIKERPGEPRFGLDINKAPEINIWNDLSWENLGIDPGAYIDINHGTLPPNLVEPSSDGEAEARARHNQYLEDGIVTWDRNTNSANLAYILYQAPVLVAVHGAEMLPKDNN